jgi:hypothetical protein
MLWRQLSPFYSIAIGIFLWLTPQPVSAASVDEWVACPSLPGGYPLFLRTSPIPIMPRSIAAGPRPGKPMLAQPTAAPPSAEIAAVVIEKKTEPKSEPKPRVAETSPTEPAGKQPAAAVREEGPFYDTFPIALKANQKPTGDQCTVTFTNLSERKIKVILGNQERALGAGESATLPVARQFVWRMEGREPQNEKVGAGDYALQIVIRR